ncbi:MAG: translation initiation factor eIF-1A [Archaeoglobaceae archaeon]|nr:translation initiation factor eIF-1A [Archaeoglobaceae archaeon]MCX8151837.1 translation initiation factor eIF-1A [Archaeoglobaceae archaeon]
MRIKLPDRSKGELLGVVREILGAGHMKVYCEDGKERLCRIPGKMKKKIWVKEGDIVIVVPWPFQPEKGDIIWRYTAPQIEWLEKRNYLKFL